MIHHKAGGAFWKHQGEKVAARDQGPGVGTPGATPQKPPTHSNICPCMVYHACAGPFWWMRLSIFIDCVWLFFANAHLFYVAFVYVMFFMFLILRMSALKFTLPLAFGRFVIWTKVCPPWKMRCRVFRFSCIFICFRCDFESYYSIGYAVGCAVALAGVA